MLSALYYVGNAHYTCVQVPVLFKLQPCQHKAMQRNMASTPLASSRVMYKHCMKMTEYNLSYTTLIVERAFNWTIQRK